VIKDYYDHAPRTDASGEPVVLDGFALVSQISRRPVAAPSGDQLLDSWLDATERELQER
jgi:hypothetical protein